MISKMRNEIRESPEASDNVTNHLCNFQYIKCLLVVESHDSIVKFYTKGLFCT